MNPDCDCAIVLDDKGARVVLCPMHRTDKERTEAALGPRRPNVFAELYSLEDELRGSMSKIREAWIELEEDR